MTSAIFASIKRERLFIASGQTASEGIGWAMSYVHCMYDADYRQPGKGVDTSGKDPVRACYLCHDPGALLRINE